MSILDWFKRKDKRPDKKKVRTDTRTTDVFSPIRLNVQQAPWSEIQEYAGTARDLIMYRLIPPDGQELVPEDVLTARDCVMTCSVCQSDFPIDLNLGLDGWLKVGGKREYPCPNCASATGIATESKTGPAGSRNWWLVVYQETVRSGAIGGRPSLKFGDVSVHDVNRLVEALSDRDRFIADAAYRALKLITGKDFGDGPTQWREWMVTAST